MKSSLVFWAALFVVSVGYVAHAEESWHETEDEVVLIRDTRNARQAKNCRYSKVKWSDCDKTTNTRSRMLTLKNSGTPGCPPTREVVKKCKSSCRFQRGTWSECDPVTRRMTRTDKIKEGSDSSCDPVREISRKCKGSKGKKPQHGSKKSV